MTAVETAAPSAPARQSRWGAKAIASLLIFVIATLLTPVALVGHWGHRTVTDTETYLATVLPLAQNPELQAAISKTITTAIVEQVDTQELVSGALGSIIGNETLADQLAGPIAAGVNSAIGSAVSTFVASKQFQTVWRELNITAQRGIVAILEGDPSGPVAVQGDAIVLNIDPLIKAAQDQLVASGIDAAAKIEIPATDRQFVLFKSAALPQIQFIYRLTAPILQWAPLLLAALFCLSLLLARNRARVVFSLGIVLVAWAAIVRFGLDAAQGSFVNALNGTAFQNAANAFWETLFRTLLTGLAEIAVFGVLLILVGWFLSSVRPGPELRAAVSRGLSDLGAGLPQGIRDFDSAHVGALRAAVLVVGVVILTVGDLLSPWHLIWTVLLTAGLFALVEFARGPESKVPAA